MGAPRRGSRPKRPKGPKSPPSGLPWVNAGFEPGHIFRSAHTAHETILQVPGGRKERLHTAPAGTFLDAAGHLRTLPTNPARHDDIAIIMRGVSRKMKAKAEAAARARQVRKPVKLPPEISRAQLDTVLRTLGLSPLPGHRGDAIKVRVARPEIKRAIRTFLKRGHTL